MENFSYHVPFYVVTGGVDLSGYSADLTPGQVGLFDRSTFSIATGSGNGKEFFFAQGPIGGLDYYGQPVTESHKSPFFMGTDVTAMYLSYPQTIQNEEWIIGFNGAASSKSLSFVAGKATRVKLYFHGQPIYRFFAGPKEYVVSYTPPVNCTTPCSAGDCPDAITDCLVHTQALVDAINTHTELSKFGVSAKLVNAPYTAATPNMTKYDLSLCDNGDNLALQAVQAQYPTQKITRTNRSGSTSTYEFCELTSIGAPANFTQTASVLAAVCGVCPGGSTLVSATDTYIVSRPLAGTETLNTSGARQTYANTVATSYSAHTISGVSGNNITITANGLIVGAPVTYVTSGTAIGGLTTATVYYVQSVVDANTVTLSATAGGSVITLTSAGSGTQTLTAVTTATFLSGNSGNAIVKIVVPSGITLTAVLADDLSYSNTEAATCSFAAGSSVAWTTNGTGVSSSRTVTLQQIKRHSCDDVAGDRIADITSIISAVQGVVIGSLTFTAGTDCFDDYTVTQNSLDCLPEDCLTNNVTFTYDDLPAFEGTYWMVVPPTITANPARECGIRITAGYIDPKFGNCSFDPSDYYETMPIKMEVSLLEEDGSACDYASLPSVVQSRHGRISRQSGEYVVREVVMKTGAYIKNIAQFDLDPRMRQAFDENLLDMVDRKAFYKLYYVSYKASYGNSYRKNEQEKFTTVFAFKETDPTTALFEANVIDVLTAKSGVALEVNN